MSGTVGNNVGRGSGIIVAAAGGLASGTKTDFFQAAAPTDWTQDATNNDKMLRVVSGTGGGTGGTSVTSTPAHNLSGSHNLAAAAHTLTTAESASHSHSVPMYRSGPYTQGNKAYRGNGPGYGGPSGSGTAGAVGGGGKVHVNPGCGRSNTTIGCHNLFFFKAFASICLIRSRVTPNLSPICSNVFVSPSLRPNRNLTIVASLSFNVSNESYN